MATSAPTDIPDGFKEPSSNVWAQFKTLLKDEAISDYILEEAQPLFFIRNGNMGLCESLIDKEMFQYLLKPIEERFMRVNPDAWHNRDTCSLDCSTQVGDTRFRVWVGQNLTGLRMVLRRFPDSIPTPEAIRLPALFVQRAVTAHQGLFLVGGATGSGKSTSLAAILFARAQRRPEHTVTLEDPIEYIFPTSKTYLFTQREIGHEMSFEAGLRAAMRQHPHVILVGEIRDTPTALAAIQAAETGHVVFASLHSGGVEETIQRYIDLLPLDQRDASCQTLAQCLDMVMNQQLITTIQGHRLAVHEVLRKTAGIYNGIKTKNINAIRQQVQFGDGHWTYRQSLDQLNNKNLLTEQEYADWLARLDTQH